MTAKWTQSDETALRKLEQATYALSKPQRLRHARLLRKFRRCEAAVVRSVRAAVRRGLTP
jgi:hypothetical protein